MPISPVTVTPPTATNTIPAIERMGLRAWPNGPWPYLAIGIVLAGVAYVPGIATGFASDDYGWLSHGVRGELGWDVAFRLTGHTNALPLEITLYHLKFTLFGFNPIGYHLFSLAGHAANVILIYALGRRLGASVRLASLAAALAAVFAAGTQAVYWMSGDPHVFASLLTLGALAIYIDHREKGGWWRYAGAVFLAALAPLLKAEGVAVIAGVVGYELFCRPSPSVNWRALPFLIAPIPFIWWEWTTTDQLSSQRGFGPNLIMSAFGYLHQLALPLDPISLVHEGGSTLHRALDVSIGSALVFEGALLVILFAVGLYRRQSWMLLLFGLAGTAPALVVTLGIQPRYVYFAGLVSTPIIAAGAGRLFTFASSRYSRQALVPAASIVVVAMIGLQTWMTGIQSGVLRAAHSESLAFRTSVLRDHPSVPSGTAICIFNSPLDVGSAIAVFADPRLGPDVRLPTVSRCDSIAQAQPGEWVYARQPDGTYVEVR
jgi:hypothetical protein